jgi:hypothetical protein
MQKGPVGQLVQPLIGLVLTVQENQRTQAALIIQLEFGEKHSISNLIYLTYIHPDLKQSVGCLTRSILSILCRTTAFWG